jgi:hypothetical protein
VTLFCDIHHCVCFVGRKPQYGYAWMHAAVKACQDPDHAKTGPCESCLCMIESSNFIFLACQNRLMMLFLGGVYDLVLFHLLFTKN